MIIFPRDASSAARSQVSSSGSTLRSTPGIDGEQREIGRLDLEERRLLSPGLDAVLPAQEVRTPDELLDAAVRRAGHAAVGVDARAHRRPRGARAEERGRKSLERVVPVVVARDGVNRLGHALERKPEAGLVVLHRAGGIDHVGGQHDEPHIGGGRGANQRVAQHVLAGIALAGVADDDEGERGRCRSSQAASP